MPERKNDTKRRTKPSVKIRGRLRSPAVPANGNGSRKASPPAYFLSLTVENVRCFGPRQTLDLSDGKGRPAHWTVLLGDNGVGKTTLLECLQAIEPDEWGSVGLCPMAVIKSEYFFDRFCRTREHAVELTVETLLDKTFKGLSSREKGENDTFNIQIGQEWPDGPVFRDDLATLKCHAYGASRHVAPISLVEEDAGRFSPSFDEDESLISPDEWLLRWDYTAAKSRHRQHAERLAQIKSALIDLLPGVTGIRLHAPGSSVDSSVDFRTYYGWVPFRGLSLGYRTLAAWMVDLAKRLFDRYPDSPNPLAEPAIVLIDEIDLHLHPTWQRELLSYLSERFPNTQFIATAHSPLVVQAAEDANIVLLRREGDHVVIENRAEQVRGWRVDQILTSDLFGLETARSPKYERVLVEREKLIGKKRLTKKDREELRRLDNELEPWPIGETKEDREAMALIREAAAAIKRKGMRGA